MARCASHPAHGGFARHRTICPADHDRRCRCRCAGRTNLRDIRLCLGSHLAGDHPECLPSRWHPIADCFTTPRYCLIMIKRIKLGHICRFLFAALFVFWVSAAAAPAHAQLVQQYFPADIPGYSGNFGASVVNRMMMLNQTNGIQVGDFIIRPVVSENAGYNSNVLGVSGSGSAEAETSASVRVNSNWARDAIGASLSVDNHRYFALPEASFTNWTAGVGGSVNLGNDIATVAYSHLNLNLSATDLGVFCVVTPAPYTVDDVRLSYQKLFSRFSVTPLLEYESFNFGQSSGANVVNFDSLRHQTVIGGVTGRYNVSPGNAAVVILRTSDAHFSSQSTGSSNNSYIDYAGFL